MYWAVHPRQAGRKDISCLKKGKHSPRPWNRLSGSQYRRTKRTEDTRHHNNTAAKSVPAKIIPATISEELCSTVAPALGLVVEVEDEPAPELVSVPVCPAAGEEVV
jgi:hypothetical protein